MATEAQISANRLNSQLSTGPRSAAGKSASSMNAFQTGLFAQSLVIRGEDPADFDRLAAEYFAQYRPATPTERDLVDTMVHSQWIIRRLRSLEASLFEYEHHSFSGFDWETIPRAYRKVSTQLARLQSRLNSLGRAWRQSLKDLQALQKEWQNQEIGFVPQTSAPSPDPDPPSPDPDPPIPDPPPPDAPPPDPETWPLAPDAPPLPTHTPDPRPPAPGP